MSRYFPAPRSSPPRRNVLRWLGLGVLGAAAARPASAFQVLPPGDYAAAVETACGSSAYHRRLLENAAARLGVTLGEPQMTEALAALRCPTCGCPLAAAASSPGAPPAASR